MQSATSHNDNAPMPPTGQLPSFDTPRTSQDEPQGIPPADNQLSPAAQSSFLTPREKEVFLGLLRGMRTNEIAADLAISPRTVEVHRIKLNHKINYIYPRPSLRDIAIKLGLIRDCPRSKKVLCTVPAGIPCADVRCGLFPKKDA